MKYFFFLTFAILLFNKSQAQKQQIQLSIGQSFNGTGDTRGLNFATEYNKYFKKKLSWSAALGGTIHDGFFPIFYEYPSGRHNDGSVRYTIAGFQATSHISYNFLNSLQHEFLFRIGTVLRYQSSSYWDVVTVLYTPITGIPYPVVVFENTTPQKTVAIGGSTQISYAYTIQQKISIGFVAGFQFDTQGDNISQVSLTIGRRF